MIVTISREYGAAGLAVADASAHALGYELLTDDVPKVVAARLGTSPEEVASRANAEATFGERMLASLDLGTAATLADVPRGAGDFDESVRREIERAIRERAARGDVVILGRYAGSVLGVRPDLLRVFLVAAPQWRIARLVDAFGWTPEVALGAIERIDAARRKLARDRYDLRWGDPHAYDLVVDVSRLSVDGAAALIAAAARALATAAPRP
ncbi:MAG: cytidylate kinase-like family protein [Candidatus Eremiobacteraeota bacterium]|nr:cytidylate kinase-like family protein [Candidatus Eremiobacteraeota bacterium]